MSEQRLQLSELQLSELQLSDDEPVKEEFCGACVAGIVAIAGAGIAKNGTRNHSSRGMKRFLFWVGILITIIAIGVIVYMLCFKKCGECAKKWNINQT
jgi:hypothetical protein